MNEQQQQFIENSGHWLKFAKRMNAKGRPCYLISFTNSLKELGLKVSDLNQ